MADLGKHPKNRLARRARSFKEDILGKINLIRSPSANRATSPSKSKLKHDEKDFKATHIEKPRSERDCTLHHVQQLNHALNYYQYAVEKEMYLMLSGSATVILESVISIHSSLGKFLAKEQSSVLLSATNQVYQNVAALIRWTDNILLYGEKSYNKESGVEATKNVKDSVENLVQLCFDRANRRDSSQLSPTLSEISSLSSLDRSLSFVRDEPKSSTEAVNHFDNFDMPPFSLHHSVSSDNILSPTNHASVNSDIPPPKPPLPQTRDLSILKRSDSRNTNTCDDVAPPLPPKKKSIPNTDYRIEPCPHMPTVSTPKFGCQHHYDPNIPSSLLDILNNQGQCMQNHLVGHSLWAALSSGPMQQKSTSSFDIAMNHSLDDLLSIDHSSFHGMCHHHQHHFEDHFSPLPDYDFKSCSREAKAFYSASSASRTSSINSLDFLNETVSDQRLLSANSLAITSSYSDHSRDSTPPPALPTKKKNRIRTSHYDNVPVFSEDEIDESCDISCCQYNLEPDNIFENHSILCPHHSIHSNNGAILQNGVPPPLPPKKKTIMAYMEMFGNYSVPEADTFYHHSLHSYHLVQAALQQVEMSFAQQQSFKSSVLSISDDSSKSNEDSLPYLMMPPALPPKKNKILECSSPPVSKIQTPPFPLTLPLSVDAEATSEPSPTVIESPSQESKLPDDVEDDEKNELDELESTPNLVYKTASDDGPDLRGGTVNALIVHATKIGTDYLYQEAFLTTYRTFISPLDLMKKLVYRYNKFIHMSDQRQRAARNAFALLIRVVDDLSHADVTPESIQFMTDFIYHLVSRGDLVLARALRKKVVEKIEAHESVNSTSNLLTSLAISVHQATLMEFKSEHLAEQMTLLDAELFQKIEIPEVLLWAKEQKEELSPNLTTFTEHFNKMSFWARSRILEQEDAKERERYVVKFIKMMKNLRKMNNFNSYLALLSALDSAPIRRLEWQRNITEGLKEYCALIDSSSSFRAYRQALAETEPPCIPYIGLILQDLTFVHIGNNDTLPDRKVNFSKRWQQFNILDSMRRFKNCHYPFKKNEQIITFFDNFNDCLCEEAMWQISESIKPRSGKKKDST